MKKVLAISCTVSFAVFWVFGGLAILAWIDKHALFSAMTVISLLGLALGLWTRARLHAHTRDLRRGERAAQPEAPARI